MIGNVATRSLATIAKRNATIRESRVAITAERAAMGDAGHAVVEEYSEL